METDAFSLIFIVPIFSWISGSLHFHLCVVNVDLLFRTRESWQEAGLMSLANYERGIRAFCKLFCCEYIRD